MKNKYLRTWRIGLAALACGSGLIALAQSPGNPPPGAGSDFPPGERRPDGPGPFGRGGPGGMMQEKTKLLKQFDKNGDNYLDADERKEALQFVRTERAQGRSGRRMGPPGRRNENQEPPQPGKKLSPADVKSFPEAALYDPLIVRTFFLEFEDADWEKELADFKNTDVDIPAKLIVDGKTYPDVGVHFRGMSSFMMVSEGHKRSLNLSLDFLHKDQQIGGYRTMNLLNSHEDPSFLRSVLSYQIDRDYVPAPKANYARVVINGESWGIYVNAQQFNKDFVKDWFGTTKGARWKVPGSPGGRGSLAYLGEDAAAYKKIYQIKSKDDEKSWADLIRLCKILNETPADKLETAITPVLDIDGALKFLALDNALINDDGYWIRTSDYSIYEDQKGRFHILPQDSNETFSKPGGPGFGRGGRPGGPPGRGDGPGFGPPPGTGGPRREGGSPGGNLNIKGVELDPLIAATDPSKPLISKLLAVPALRTRYLSYVRDIADKWLDWNKLGPIATQYHALIEADVRADTRKLDSTEEFEKDLADEIPAEGANGGFGGGLQNISIKSFAAQRRAFLLKTTAPKPFNGATKAE